MIEMADYLHMNTPMLNGRGVEKVYTGYEKAFGEKEEFSIFRSFPTNNCQTINKMHCV